MDLHAHTWFSGDALTSPHEFVRRARAAGLGRIAVTDHGTVRGAMMAHNLDPELVIVGEEIRCANGVDLIGLFLQKHVPGGLSLEATAAQIREQGGIVYAPHPFAYLVKPFERGEELMAVADVVEVFNARAFLPRWNQHAASRAAALKLPAVAGSDAHLPHEIGRTYFEMPPFDDAQSYLVAVQRALLPSLSRGSPLLHCVSAGVRALRAVVGRGNGTSLQR